MENTQPTTEASAVPAVSERVVTAFVCVNCARGPRPPAQGIPARSAGPAIDWPCKVKEVWLPCAGRLQPEHLLKALEDGADAVCILGCEEDNCHYLQGSRRAALRADYVGRLMEQVGLEPQRVIKINLPGSAKEDLFAGEGQDPPSPADPADLAERLAGVRDELARRLAELPPTPLRASQAPSREDSPDA